MSEVQEGKKKYEEGKEGTRGSLRWGRGREGVRCQVRYVIFFLLCVNPFNEITAGEDRCRVVQISLN